MGSGGNQEAVKPAHTPGPWCITGREDCFRIREEASDAILATTDDGGHPDLTIFDFDQQLANARLIAASPTMFSYVRRRAKEGDAEAAAIVEAIDACR